MYLSLQSTPRVYLSRVHTCLPLVLFTQLQYIWSIFIAPSLTETATSTTATLSSDRSHIEFEGTRSRDLDKNRPNESIKYNKFPGTPRFAGKYEKREYLKGGLALTFRIFGRYGFDQGTPSHSPTIRGVSDSVSDMAWNIYCHRDLEIRQPIGYILVKRESTSNPDVRGIRI